MREIQIENLNKRQRQIMDLLWSCDTTEQLKTLINALPELKDRQDAWSLAMIAMLEDLEQKGGLGEYADSALSIISRCSRK